MQGNEKQRRITIEGLAMLGAQNIAYIKPTAHEGRKAYAICAADGAELAVVAERDIAFAVARQHDLEPLSVH
jgi:hypothetical protein